LPETGPILALVNLTFRGTLYCPFEAVQSFAMRFFAAPEVYGLLLSQPGMNALPRCQRTNPPGLAQMAGRPASRPWWFAGWQTRRRGDL